MVKIQLEMKFNELIYSFINIDSFHLKQFKYEVNGIFKQWNIKKHVKNNQHFYKRRKWMKQFLQIYDYWVIFNNFLEFHWKSEKMKYFNDEKTERRNKLWRTSYIWIRIIRRFQLSFCHSPGNFKKICQSPGNLSVQKNLPGNFT